MYNLVAMFVGCVLFPICLIGKFSSHAFFIPVVCTNLGRLERAKKLYSASVFIHIFPVKDCPKQDATADSEMLRKSIESVFEFFQVSSNTYTADLYVDTTSK